MKIFVTGGIGYLGSAFVANLLKEDKAKEIVVYDQFNKISSFYTSLPLGNPKLRFVEGDILDRRKIKKELKGCQAVVHLGITSISPRNVEETHLLEQINHWGTAELIDIAEDAGVKKFILGSSALVYGETQPGLPAKEEYDLMAVDAIGQSIIRAEKHSFRFLGNQKIQMYVFRLAELFGLSPHTSFESGINKWVLYSKLVNKITLFGEGNQVHSYLTVKQAVEVLNKALFEQIPEGIYNLSDVQTSLLDLLDILKEINPELEFVFVNHHLKMPSLEISSVLAQETFGLKNVELKKSLLEMWEKLG